MNYKTITLFACYWLISVLAIFAQNTNTLSIDSCFEMAKSNYPLVKQMALIQKTSEYNISNASKENLPKISVNGQATYQSAVTEIPIPSPNVPDISKDQYKIYGEVNQSLTNPVIVKQQNELIKANTFVEEQKLDVTLYRLNERIANLYFGILLIDAQIQQTELLKDDIKNGIDKTNAAIANGTALKSSVNLLKAELIKVNQKTIELKSNRKAYTDMLGLFINQHIGENTKMETPLSQPTIETINRPELKLYDFEKKRFDIQSKLITAKTLPHLSLFIQGGYGRPALNFLSNDFEGYYISGIRLNWNISDYYTSKKDKELLTIGQNSVDVERETFLFNTNLSLRQQSSEVSKYQELLESDNDLIKLRESIKQTANNQLEYGTITTHDYLDYVNAENLARQNKWLHQIQLLMAQYIYNITTGN